MTIQGAGCTSFGLNTNIFDYTVDNVWFSNPDDLIFSIKYTDSNGTELERDLTEHIDYTLTLLSPVDYQSYKIYNSVLITLNALFYKNRSTSSHFVLKVKRKTSKIQTLNSLYNGHFSDRLIEYALDKLTAIVQELDCEIKSSFNQTLNLPPISTAGNGKILVTSGGQLVLTDQRVPNVVGQPDNQILVTQNNKLTYAPMPTVNSILPSQNTYAGNYLQTDGTNVSWTKVNVLPNQSSNAGKVLSTDGTNPLWKDCYCPPNPSTEVDGRILETKGGKLEYVDAPSATNPLPPLKGNKDKLLAVKTDESGTEWVNKSAILPNQSGNAGKVLITDGTNTNWEAQRTPVAPNTDGKILTSQGGQWVSSDPKGATQSDDFVEDVSNGLLGICKIEKTGVGESFNVTFTGKAVFYDVGTNKLNLVDPQNDTNANIVGGNYTYVYLLDTGIVQYGASQADVPRGSIVLGILEHLDGARITNIDTVYTSSNVDAHRIKDVYKSYKPVVEGCTISVQTFTDNTDPNNPTVKTQLAVSSGRFFNYCADDTKQYDNYFIDIVEKPLGAGFRFRSIEPEDYGKNWDKSASSMKNDEFLEAKVIATNTPTDLTDGHATLYPVMISSTGNIVLIVPRTSFPSARIPYVDGDEVWRNFEKDIDRVTLENYALIGFIYADKENGYTTWGYGSSIVSIRNKYDAAKGTSTKLPSTKYATALVEHKSGVIQEYDPLSYTLGEWGDMINYPGDYEKDLTRGYWKTAIDDNNADGTARKVGLFDVADNVVENTSNVGYRLAADSIDYYRQDSQFTVYNPLPENNHSIPVKFNIVKTYTKKSNGYNSDNYTVIAFRPKIDFNMRVTISILFNGVININLKSYAGTLTAFRFNNFNPQATITEGGAYFTSVGTSVRIKEGTTSIPANTRVTYHTLLPIPVKNNVPNNGNFAAQKLEFETVPRYIYSVPVETTSVTTVTLDMEDANNVAAKDHIRLKYGKLSELNVNADTATVVKGNRPTDLKAGDIIIFLNIMPKSGNNYLPSTTWNCDLKHNVLMTLLPSISLVSGSGTEKPAEIAQVITWHSARYTLRGVTASELADDDVIIRIKNTTDVTGLLAGMNFKLGAAMADDTF